MPGTRLRSRGGGKSTDSSRATVRPKAQGSEHSRFTSSLALPSEIEGTPNFIWLHQESDSLEDRLDLTLVEAQQEVRRQELKLYLQQLKQDSLTSQAGVGSTFGAAFYSLVSQYCQQRKLEYESVRGWIPTTESQTSATQLANPSEDPRVQEGLCQILHLDERLMQKSAEAAMVSRETFPEAALAADKKQAEKDQKLLLASLERERARQARANKLALALEALDSSNKENESRLEERALYCMLQPEEEALVDRLLAQTHCNSNAYDIGQSVAQASREADWKRKANTSLLVDQHSSSPGKAQICWQQHSQQPVQSALLQCMLQSLQQANEDDETWSCNPFEPQAGVDTGRSNDSQGMAGLSLAELDARLEEFAHEPTEEGRDQYYRSAANLQQKELSQTSIQTASTSTLPSADVDTASVSNDTSLAEALLKDDATDYLTARRQAKQIADTLDDIDARLRALQTAALPHTPTKAELAQLLRSCSRQVSNAGTCFEQLHGDTVTSIGAVDVI